MPSFAEDTASWDVPSDLLVESRKGLADELDRVEKKRSWWRMPAFSVVFTPMRLLESARIGRDGIWHSASTSATSRRVVTPSVRSNRSRQPNRPRFRRTERFPICKS